MASVVIVDTSVFLNLLNVPGFNQDRSTVISQFEDYIKSDSSFLLPVTSVFETGNHIGQLSSGGDRRRYAGIFREQVRQALEEEAPWVLVPLPHSEELSAWLVEFPDFAMRGVGLVDLSIIRMWEEACHRHRAQRVVIWSLDNHLEGYDRP